MMRDCWVLVGFGPDPYCPQRPSCRPLARELISVPGRDSIMRTLVFAKIVQRLAARYLYLTKPEDGTRHDDDARERRRLNDG